MKIVRIYEPGAYAVNQTIMLSPAASQHVGVVLRMQPGERLTLFSGDDREFAGTIESVTKKKVMVHIESMQQVSRESHRKIHLAQAISKGDRMELVIQKAVELGVASITPLMTARCVVRLDLNRLAKKQAQWQAIAIAACEQSGRNNVPVIQAACSLDDYFHGCNKHTLKLVLDPEGNKSWRDYTPIECDIALLIGPEGGLTGNEILEAKNMDFKPLRLGPRVLRTETAAITALSILQAVCGDL